MLNNLITKREQMITSIKEERMINELLLVLDIPYAKKGIKKYLIHTKTRDKLSTLNS